MSDDIRSLIAERLAEVDQHRADAPKRRAIEQARREVAELERKHREQQALRAAIQDASVLDYTFTFGLVPDDDRMEYVGIRNERLGNFAIVKTWKQDRERSLDSLRGLARWYGVTFRVIAARPTRDECVAAMLVYYHVDGDLP